MSIHYRKRVILSAHTDFNLNRSIGSQITRIWVSKLDQFCYKLRKMAIIHSFIDRNAELKTMSYRARRSAHASISFVNLRPTVKQL
jgi:hypothetical protein